MSTSALPKKFLCTFLAFTLYIVLSNIIILETEVSVREETSNPLKDDAPRQNSTVPPLKPEVSINKEASNPKDKNTYLENFEGQNSTAHKSSKTTIASICMHRFERTFGKQNCNDLAEKWFEEDFKDNTLAIKDKESCVERGKRLLDKCNLETVLSFFGPKSEQPRDNASEPKCEMKVNKCSDTSVVPSRTFEIDLKGENFPAQKCQQSYNDLQQRCGDQNSVGKTYVGPGAMSEMKSDGSWDVVDINSIVLNFRPLELNPNQSCYEVTMKLPAYMYSSSPSSYKFCYPLFNIIGYAKCGTSMIYYMLTQHPKIIAGARTKEYCQNQPRQHRTFFQFFRGFSEATEKSENSDIVLVNGCIQPDNIVALDYVLRQPKSVYIVTIRDPVAMAWASYNFWCMPGYDHKCETGGWTREGHMRSPEDFQKKITERFPRPLLIPHYENFKSKYTQYLKSFTDAMKTKNMVVLSSEMFNIDVKKVFTLVSIGAIKETGFVLDWYPNLLEMKDLKVNAGNDRGGETLSKNTTIRNGVYEISGFRPMLQNTQELLKLWWEECEIINNMTSWDYNCTPRVNIIGINGQGAVIQQNNSDAFMNVTSKLRGYLNVKTCKHRFEAELKNSNCSHLAGKGWFKSSDGTIAINDKKACLEEGKRFQYICQVETVLSFFGPEKDLPLVYDKMLKPKCTLKLNACPKVPNGPPDSFEIDVSHASNPSHQCVKAQMQWQKLCADQNSVEKTYVGPGAMSEIESDGSWDIIDIDNNVLNFKPLDIKPHQSCYQVTLKLPANVYSSSYSTYKFCYPLFNIVGYPKCGTSMIYHMLSKHPKIIKAATDKEYCQDMPGQHRSFFHYFYGFVNVTSSSDKDIASINGCIQPDNVLGFEYFLRQPKTVHIMTVRDGPQRAWAAYNFWCIPGNDKACNNGGWTRADHVRSPRDFNRKIKQGHESYLIPKHDTMKVTYTNLINSFNNGVIIASEMLKVDIKKVFTKISSRVTERTGFVLEWYPPLLNVQNVSVNTGNEKGTGALSKKTATPDGVYEISGFKPMFKETKELLRSWWEECQMIRNMTSWDYDCIANT